MKIFLILLTAIYGTVLATDTCSTDPQDIATIRGILAEMRKGRYVSSSLKSRSTGQCRSKVNVLLVLLRKLSKKYNLMTAKLVSEAEIDRMRVGYEKELRDFKEKFEETKSQLSEDLKKQMEELNQEIKSLETAKQKLEFQLSNLQTKLQSIRRDLCMLKLRNSDLSYAVDLINKMSPLSMDELEKFRREFLNHTWNFEPYLRFIAGINDLDVQAAALSDLHYSNIQSELLSGATVSSLETILLQLSDKIVDETSITSVQKTTIEKITTKVKSNVLKVYTQWADNVCDRNYNLYSIKTALDVMMPIQMEQLAELILKKKDTNQKCFLDMLATVGRCSTIGAFQVLLKTSLENYLVPIVIRMLKLKDICKMAEENIQKSAVTYLEPIDKPKFNNENLNNIIKCNKNFKIHSDDSRKCIQVTAEKQTIKWGTFNSVNATTDKTKCSIFALEELEDKFTRFKIRDKASGDALIRINDSPNWKSMHHFAVSNYINGKNFNLDKDDEWFLETNASSNFLYISNKFDYNVRHITVNYLTRFTQNNRVYLLFPPHERRKLLEANLEKDARWKIQCA
uniref:Putative 62 kDa family member n=1 Tax=Culex tarsalis TaxID=7177 RepID=A0A1Q3F6W4_CULTA